MMISKSTPTHDQCYVWIWLPNQNRPVVAGKIIENEDRFTFYYALSYLKNPVAIPIDDKELPLKPGPQERINGIESLPGALRDSTPDAWGRRVIMNKLLGTKAQQSDPFVLSELVYMLESGSDRIGALDFQLSKDLYIPREDATASLESLLQLSESVEKGMPLSSQLEQVFYHGTSIGGARPKAGITAYSKKYIAKFSSSTDIYNVIKAEFFAMTLAKYCGLDVANVELVQALGKDILLVERFDRTYGDAGETRKLMQSALTLLGLDEMTGRYASYQDFSEIIRLRFINPKATLEELFSRLVFNILCGNSDDHARNHAAFWDGRSLSLTPAYDICPQLRIGGECSQGMCIIGQDNRSLLKNCLLSAPYCMLSEQKAREIISKQIGIIEEKWDDVALLAKLSPIENKLFKKRIFMNPYAFEDYPDAQTLLRK